MLHSVNHVECVSIPQSALPHLRKTRFKNLINSSLGSSVNELMDNNVNTLRVKRLYRLVAMPSE
jgi:hypothetical protein